MVFRILAALLLAFPAFAVEVGGVNLPDKASVAGAELALTGAGVRKRLFFDVYAIGLYVRERGAEPVAQAGPKRVHIHMLRDVDAQTFTDALVEGIKANHSDAEAKGFEPRIAQLAQVVQQAGEARKGMAITLDWSGGHTQITIDGKPAGPPIEGEDFYRALLRIWLGPSPVQDDLKKALLGR